MNIEEKAEQYAKTGINTDIHYSTGLYYGYIAGYNEAISEKKITLKQKKSLHLYFEMIAKSLNEIGITFLYRGLNKSEIEIPYTPYLVKEMLWKPIQMALFEKESTTKLTNEEINKIIEVINKFFAERGVELHFPSIQSLLFDYEKRKNT